MRKYYSFIKISSKRLYSRCSIHTISYNCNFHSIFTSNCSYYYFSKVNSYSYI